MKKYNHPLWSNKSSFNIKFALFLSSTFNFSIKNVEIILFNWWIDVYTNSNESFCVSPRTYSVKKSNKCWMWFAANSHTHIHFPSKEPKKSPFPALISYSIHRIKRVGKKESRITPPLLLFMALLLVIVGFS